MTTSALREYLTTERPPVIDSAYQLAQRHSILESTARTILVENGYRHDKEAKCWKPVPTQLDQILTKLDQILARLDQRPQELQELQETQGLTNDF